MDITEGVVVWLLKVDGRCDVLLPLSVPSSISMSHFGPHLLILTQLHCLNNIVS
jgi:hypothetical protein